MENKTNPLAKFSLAGQGNALVDNAATPEPILGNICLRGEVSVWYAPPNTGKTLIILSLVTDAVVRKVIKPEKVFYVNADDSASGLAAKVQIADEFGIHCLAPGQQGFELSLLVPAMREMAKTGAAKGTLIVVDTLKKVADLMSKAECREFGKGVREFSMAGGTLVGLAHTNKSRGANRKLIHAGTTDILEDFDSGYLLDTEERESNGKQRVVRFECIKNRGPNAAEAFYRFSTERELNYAERLVTVQETDLHGYFDEPNDDGPEKLVTGMIKWSIEQGVATKMAIASKVQGECNVSRRKVLKVLETFTGDDPEEHLWNFERKDRGAHKFYLLSPKKPESPPPAE